MSVAGIGSSNIFDFSNAKAQNRSQMQQEFEQLGKDLSSGNLSAAQSDFATLQKNAPSGSSSKTNSISQEFSQLGQDLQSGNLSSAQQDYSTIQQTMQQRAAQGHHHHHHGGGSGNSGANAISQMFSELGQALQSGNLTQAQQAYTTLQQDFQASGQNGGGTSNSQTATNWVTVTT
jgi:outer membrane protein assembly factor BamD (BamD/ComL family)